MAYAPTSWVDNTTQITAARLNNMESGIAAALTSAPLAMLPFGAPSGGSLQQPSNMSASTGIAATAGQCTFVPIDIGLTTWNFTGFAIDVTTAQVGGTTSMIVGVYPDDGTGGMPNLVGGPIAQVTFTSAGAPFTSTGGKNGTAAWTPSAPGRYWLAALYLVATAPTTIPQFNSVSAVGNSLWTPFTPGAASRSLASSSTSLSALPTTQIAVITEGSNTGITVCAITGTTQTTFTTAPSYAQADTNFMGRAAAAPSSGTYAVGNYVHNTVPAAGGSTYFGWVCTTAGSPGTWKGFGLIQT